ncbi:unnamed protein product [Phytophthora fragariaefolia]|uniref:Unnamed protein product n=1 Tax=Phytophthora fragariaefolia TaxID=1490495 RepID=A0A9W6YH56_9STRA|nr:unnamed protein product [Phytophthora fragariaefolia]GMF88802.1 unnamed protein product [Phytophthora fragariaefolia]
MTAFMTWEHAAQAAAGNTSSSQQQGGCRGNYGSRGGDGARGANGGAAACVSNSGRNNGASSPPTRCGRGGGPAQGVASSNPEWKIGGSKHKKNAEPSQLQKMCRLEVEAREGTAANDTENDGNRHGTRTVLPTMRPTNTAEIILYLEANARVAEELGQTLDGAEKLRGILHARADNFRAEFGHDPPLRDATMKIRLKKGAAPVRSQPRRYLPNDLAFLDRHTASLLKYGLIYQNRRSRWASAPQIVKRMDQAVNPTTDPRMKLDTRSVKERTEQMPWPMPVLEVVLGKLEGVSQSVLCAGLVPGLLAAVPASRLSSAVLVLFAWLDDILGLAEDEDALLDVLDTDTVLKRFVTFGLTLHAKKCPFLSIEIKWCGRIVSGDGVRHYPDRIQGLAGMQLPTTAGGAAAVPVRGELDAPEYSLIPRITVKLYDALEHTEQRAGPRKKLNCHESGSNRSDVVRPKLAVWRRFGVVCSGWCPWHPNATA